MIKHKKSLSDFNDVLQTLLKRAESSYPDRAHKVWDVWQSAVGEKLSERCFPLSLRKGKLFIGVVNSPWMQQLSFLKEDLKNSINAAIGHEIVKEIKFKLSEPPEKPREHKPNNNPPWLRQSVPEEVKTLMEADLASVTDPEIRKMVLRARMRWEQLRRFREAREDS